jgi:putative DNA primase/helicase
MRLTQSLSDVTKIALDYALRYHWPVFPVALTRLSNGKIDKRPLVKWGTFASCDPAQIEAWWRRWPRAVIGVSTGRPSGVIILDIDIKDGRHGFDTLAHLGRAILPPTPMAHTRTGGVHTLFADRADTEIRNSVGVKGLGEGLDIRGTGGFFVPPCPGSGYTWDPHYNLETVPLMLAPIWLGYHPSKERSNGAGRNGKTFNPQAILDEACTSIRTAADGEKHHTLNRETFSVATLVAAELLREVDARRALKTAVSILIQHSDAEPQRTWKTFECAFADGLAAPRRTRP